VRRYLLGLRLYYKQHDAGRICIKFEEKEPNAWQIICDAQRIYPYSKIICPTCKWASIVPKYEGKYWCWGRTWLKINLRNIKDDYYFQISEIQHGAP
jgi:hypothetical protein